MNFKKISFLVACMFFGLFTINAQETLDIVKGEKVKVDAEIDRLKGELGTLEAKSAALKTKIEKLSGWMTGFGGTAGFGLNRNKNWIASPNPNSSSSRLALGLSGYANNIKEKTLWRNSLLAAKEWQDIDTDSETEKDNLFDNGTVDILNLSSLGGYRINKYLAATALGELNTSIENFLKPGTLDLGAGITWTPNNDFVLVLHPLNYHMNFSGYNDVKNTGALGAKLRAEYNKKFTFVGLGMAFSSTLTSFLPYSNNKTLIDPMQEGVEPWNAGLFEYTWINNLSFKVWKGIGVGIGFGLRQAEFESQKIQNYLTTGLSYTL